MTHSSLLVIRGTTRSALAPTGAAWIALGVLFFSVQIALPAPPDRLDFFEQRTRPTLVNECYECHGAKKQKGGLRVDFRDGLVKGGDSGPVLIPGYATKILLIQSIRHEAPDSKMPKDRPQLADSVIADSVTWTPSGRIRTHRVPPPPSNSNP